MLIEIDEKRKEFSDFKHMIIDNEFAKRTSHNSIVLKIDAKYFDINFDFWIENLCLIIDFEIISDW